MPIVLVQNPVIVNSGYDWQDILGEQYHFPNQYKNRCVPGKPFIYYRGTRRPDGKRATPEYFGHGVIGDVWRDETIPESAPKKDWAWYCRIDDYVPFPAPVSAKANGQFLERIARNHWSVGVRPLPQDVYETILQSAGMLIAVTEVAAPAPEFTSVTITESQESLLIPRKPNAAGQGSSNTGGRYSKNSSVVGKRAEEIAYRYLVEHASALKARNIRWLSRDGITPGWDIQYEDENGQTIAVEVKGSTAPLFGNIEVTVGEWNAAVTLKDRYWLYLVADCLTPCPKLHRLHNPAALVASETAQLLPIVFRFSKLADQ